MIIPMKGCKGESVKITVYLIKVEKADSEAELVVRKSIAVKQLKQMKFCRYEGIYNSRSKGEQLWVVVFIHSLRRV